MSHVTLEKEEIHYVLLVILSCQLYSFLATQHQNLLLCDVKLYVNTLLLIYLTIYIANNFRFIWNSLIFQGLKVLIIIILYGNSY